MSQSIAQATLQLGGPGGPEHRQVFEPMDIARLMSQAPWWVVSLVIHAILLIFLATVNFSTARSMRPLTEMVVDPTVMILDSEVPPPWKQSRVGDPEEGGTPDTPDGPARDLTPIVFDVPLTRTAPIGPGGLDWLFPKDFGPGFDPSKTRRGGPMTPIPEGSPRNPIDVVDSLAREILKTIQKEQLLVVLLYDESPSLVEDRKLIARQIRQTIGDLRKEVLPTEAARLRWAVVSYSEKPTLWLQPTMDMKKVVEATNQVGKNPSGTENMIEAIQFTMKTLGSLKRRMFLVVVSDEEGDDVKKAEDVNAVMTAMIAAKTRFFVFGREASFQLARVREWDRDEHGERVGMWGWADRGLESCDYEWFPPDWFWNGQYSYNGIPAGFGCWVQSMLAHQTGGTYYMLSDVPPKYDEDLMKDYQPEWEPRSVYEKRTQESRMRKTMSKLFAEYAAIRPTHWLTRLDRIKAQTKEENQKAQALLKWVDRAIDDLEPMKPKSAREKNAPKRWEANYDLTMAQLYKLKFEASEYIHATSEALRKGFPKAKKNQKFNLFSVYYDWQATEAATGRRGNREMAQAKEAFKRVIEKHGGTPWAEIASAELKRTAPLAMTPVFHVEPVVTNK